MSFAGYMEYLAYSAISGAIVAVCLLVCYVLCGIVDRHMTTTHREKEPRN